MTFQSAFCAYAGCAESAFERTLFRRALYRHALPLASLIRYLSPDFFRADLELIRWVGADDSLAEIEEDIRRFSYDIEVRRRWLRTGLRLHLNPTRLRNLARRCMAT